MTTSTIPTLDQVREAARTLRRKWVVREVEEVAAIRDDIDRALSATALIHELQREFDADHRAERNLKPLKRDVSEAALVIVRWCGGGAR